MLTSLLADARDQLGFAPSAAVISVPALFELPQSPATARAGELAGLEEVVLIQEPVASAVAAGWRAEDADGGGNWLVFDLGGGTLDVSLLETRDGLLRVVDHDGDNFLGGRDIDGAVTEWALGELARRGRADLALEPGRRGAAAPGCGPRASRPRSSCRAPSRRVIALPELAAGGGGTVDVDLEMTRAELDGADGAVHRARAVRGAQRCWTRTSCAPADVARVVLVGGPTLMPALRARVRGAVRRPHRRGGRSDDHRGARRRAVRGQRGRRRARRRARARGRRRRRRCASSIRP